MIYLDPRSQSQSRLKLLPDNSAITVIIPNLNGKRFLEICLDSIIRQTFQDFFVIVIDNGSVDGSAEFIRDNYADVKVIEFKENKGIHTSLSLILLPFTDISMTQMSSLNNSG